jgi:hypothetical protein
VTSDEIVAASRWRRGILSGQSHGLPDRNSIYSIPRNAKYAFDKDAKYLSFFSWYEGACLFAGMKFRSGKYLPSLTFNFSLAPDSAGEAGTHAGTGQGRWIRAVLMTNPSVIDL